MHDKDLVAQVLDGKMDAFEQLVDKYQAPLVRYVVFLIHDEAAAEDAVQEAFIKAYRNLRSYNPKYKFSSWLYRIAHNAAMDGLAKHPPVAVEDSIIDTLATTEDKIAQTMDTEFTKQQVHECLNKLPMKYREPLALFYLEHNSYEAVSDTLHISRSAAGVRINRAKQKLKDICQSMGVHHA